MMKYAKALVAFLGAIATALLTLGTNPEVAAVVPTTATNWFVTAAGVVGTGIIGFLVRNRLTIEQIDAALAAGDLTLKDLKETVRKRETPTAGPFA